MSDTPTLHHDADGIPDFTSARKVRRFRIDGDVFDCAPAVPVDLARKLSKERAKFASLVPANVDPEQFAHANPGLVDSMMDVIIEILEEIMVPASAARFAERMGSVTEPIDLSQLVAVSQWMMEDLSERPTQPGSDSSDFSTTTTTTPTSTAGVPLEVSIPTASPLPVS
jgi:hypothetical protein